VLALELAPGAPEPRLFSRRNRGAVRLCLALALLAASPAVASPPQLDMPVDCTLGETCFIQNYVDRDPSPNARDFTCATLTYDTHRGTDIALFDMNAMHTGVTVHAAAPGTVTATRDGMPDILASDPDAPDLTNRACGNAVIVDHGDGWETRYCHLKRGSLQVHSGDTVTPDSALAQVGLSGKTEFPHLHIAVRHDGKVIDPFQPNASTCGTTGETLWKTPIPYTAGGLIAAGFSAAIPDFPTIKAGNAHSPTLPTTAPAFVLWAHVFGGRKGDALDMTITGPRGTFLAQSIDLTRTQARLFRATGRNRKADPWPPGAYTGTAILIRNGQEIDAITTTVTIAP